MTQVYRENVTHTVTQVFSTEFVTSLCGLTDTHVFRCDPEEWLSSSEDGWYEQKQQEESAEEEGRRKKSSPPVHTQTKNSSRLDTDAQPQQGFINERAPLNRTVADSSRNVNEHDDEDERDDVMSEHTRTTRTEKRKEILTDENSKRVTGTVTCN